MKSLVIEINVNAYQHIIRVVNHYSYVAYSGGKDSDAIRILFELSGAKYDLVHNQTTADAPLHYR